MNLLNKCELWIDRHELWKVLDAIEGMPEKERTPALTSTLAWAYALLAGGERPLYEKALRMFIPLFEVLENDYRWNMRIAYVYMSIDQEGRAYLHLHKALQIRPGDPQARVMRDRCERQLICPLFRLPFRQRVHNAWEAFMDQESALRECIDHADTQEAMEKGLAIFHDILKDAVQNVSFALGLEENRYLMTLSPDANMARLWKIDYFVRAMPDELKARWTVQVGRPPGQHAFASTHRDMTDVTVAWKRTEGGYAFRLHGGELAGHDEETLEEARSLVCLVLGELTAMAVTDEVTVADQAEEHAISLSLLSGVMAIEGIMPITETEACIARHGRTYRGHPIRDRNADWRLDVTEGYSTLKEAVDGYYNNDDDVVDECHQDGIAAAFFAIRREDCPKTHASAQTLAAELEEYLKETVGEEAVTIIGWAEGLYSLYVDFLAWDLQPVLKEAEQFFRSRNFRRCAFHTFRRRIPTMYLLNAPEEAAEPRAEKPVITREFAAHLEEYVGEKEGYFEAMLNDLEEYFRRGAMTGQFTPNRVQEDLEAALWYSYACNNIGTYEGYWKAAQWMPPSEKHAAGCGMWYYRYSVALMNCGRLEEARTYAEKGAKEEPDYPWIWLQVAKLRSHFGDKAGALDAVERGLFLEPESYEFQTLRREIQAGATLEEMEYHWIDPESDKKLHEGLDEEADEKIRALSCITTDEEGLREVLAMFHLNEPDPKDLYCSFQYPVCGHPIRLVFLMNSAGMSKLNRDWLRKCKASLDSGEWLTREHGEDEGLLAAVFIGLDYTVLLRYWPSRGDQFFDTAPGPVQRREEEDGSGAALLLTSRAWNPEEFAAAIQKAGVDADNVADDTIMATEGAMTAVLCFYNDMVEKPGLPDHRAYVTAAVIGGEEEEPRQQLLNTVIRACAGLPDVAAVLVGGHALTPAAYLAGAGETNS